ncbi:thioredoxin domain-containing protein [Bacteroides sp. OttesenSCG-928-E20]|nr:thioredoxin domain-containing protein [Bacteroides sp. OttesenSCG-928-E20]
MKQSVFSSFLKQLKVKHTQYADLLYNSHPYRDTLWGISALLSDYKIENAGIIIEDKNINSLNTPFVAYAGSDFVVVEKVANHFVEYIWNNESIILSVDEFNHIWSGIVLIAETSPSSGEPNYYVHYRAKIINCLKQAFVVLPIILLIVYSFFANNIYHSINATSLFVVNLLGVFTCCLLVQKQIKTESKYGDKICSLFKGNTCNNVLDSKAAKLWGVFGWAEIGLAYFITNAILIPVFPNLIIYLAFINVIALPYTCWSIWYQYIIAKQWCILCIAVQVLLWLLFIINLLSGYIIWPDWSFHSIVVITISYPFVYGILNHIIEKMEIKEKLLSTEHELNRLKLKEEVFDVQLKQQPYYNVDISSSRIFFGNPESNILITIISNPHCNPCAALHHKVEELLKETNETVCIQYIFTAFNNELIKSSRFLIACYLNESYSVVKEMYNKWFLKEKHNSEKYINQFDYNLSNTDVEEEWNKHQKWLKAAQIVATPTVLINGYRLPESYKLEDIKHFIKIN